MVRKREGKQEMVGFCLQVGKPEHYPVVRQSAKARHQLDPVTFRVQKATSSHCDGYPQQMGRAPVASSVQVERCCLGSTYNTPIIANQI